MILSYSTMFKHIFLALFAFVIFFVFAPVLFAAQLFLLSFQHGMQWFVKKTYVEIDKLGALLLYRQPEWTISAYTYYLYARGSRAAGLFMRFIDLLFGSGHCEREYKEEMRKKTGI